jgi:hypothetical protein
MVMTFNPRLSNNLTTSFSRDKLDHIHKLLDLSIDLDKFIEIYDQGATFDFLFINVKEQTFRKNFNKLLEVDVF